MSDTRISMRKLHEILRMRFDNQLSLRQISRSVRVSVGHRFELRSGVPKFYSELAFTRRFLRNRSCPGTVSRRIITTVIQHQN